MKQTIRITCDVKDHLAPKDLTPLQGALKSLEAKKYEKLKKSLLRHGFVFPEYVWKNGGKNYVTDGHQRLRAITKMIAEGISLEGGKIPIVYVQAKNKKHAMELILAAMSEYGGYEEENVYTFIGENDLDWERVKDVFDFPQISMGKLEVGWFGNREFEEPKAVGGVKGSVDGRVTVSINMSSEAWEEVGEKILSWRQSYGAVVDVAIDK